MVYNLSLARRCESLLKGKKGFVQMKMFGGVGFLLRGNMCIGVYKDFLILRLGPLQSEKALKDRNTREFDLTGRPMRGWVMVHGDGVKTRPQLAGKIEMAVDFVKALPAKK